MLKVRVQWVTLLNAKAQTSFTAKHTSLQNFPIFTRATQKEVQLLVNNSCYHYNTRCGWTPFIAPFQTNARDKNF